eukprot:Nk52_evm123s485 gene=Nk52_evmTU123s485
MDDSQLRPRRDSNGTGKRHVKRRSSLMESGRLYDPSTNESDRGRFSGARRASSGSNSGMMGNSTSSSSSSLTGNRFILIILAMLCAVVLLFVWRTMVSDLFSSESIAVSSEKGNNNNNKNGEPNSDTVENEVFVNDLKVRISELEAKMKELQKNAQKERDQLMGDKKKVEEELNSVKVQAKKKAERDKNDPTFRGYIRPGMKRSFKEYNETMYSWVNGIPHILHQSYKTTKIEKDDWNYYAKSWRKYMPHWDYWFWVDNDNEALVKNYHPEFLEFYHKAYSPVMKADFSRLLYMYHFGGVYADFDFQLLRSLEEYPLIQEDNIVILGTVGYDLLWEQSIPNAIMMSTPGHPFWAYCINLAMYRALHAVRTNTISHESAEYYTGPGLLHRCVAEYGNPTLYKGPKYKTESIDPKNYKLPAKNQGESDDDYTARTAFTLKMNNTTPNFGFQGDTRVYLARPWEFYPISWDPLKNGMNKTLQYAQAHCDLRVELLRAQKKLEKSVFVGKQFMLSPQIVMDLCTRIYTDLGGFAVTFWTHEWSVAKPKE